MNGLPGGYYSVTVNDDFGCSASATAFISEPQKLEIHTSVTSSASQANTGTALAVLTGGTMPFHYNWSEDGGIEALALGLKPGLHTIFVEDANGCLISSQVKVPDEVLDVAVKSTSPSACEDGKEIGTKLSPSNCSVNEWRQPESFFIYRHFQVSCLPYISTGKD
ncbi:MAG: hypothetical protein IPG90_15150 [Bacteroidetes bacterium]|nr:hypothetical protein [Bacteroidota bacterium]